MKKVISALFVALMLSSVATTFAHEVSNINVVCDEGITISGIKFGENLPREVRLVGPDGYFESYIVTTDDWTHTFPVGSNGQYVIDWDDSGDFGPVDFIVDCAEPTPTPIKPTPLPKPSHPVLPSPSIEVVPTPKPTVPPTDTE